MINQFNNQNNNNIQNQYIMNNINQNQQIFNNNNIGMNNNLFNQQINKNQINQNNNNFNFNANQNNKQNIPQNNKDNNTKPPKKHTSIKEFNYVPMIGLVNLGQTCFMNSVLQCFSNLYHFTNYFLNPSKSKYIEKNTITMVNEKANSLSVAYKELINNLWNGKRNTPFRPDNFKKILGKINPLFKDNSAGDSKDFAIFFIMQIHNELNNIDVELNKENKPANFVQQDNLNVNPYNQQQVFQYFINDFAMNQNSVITNLFYGINQSMFECQVCKMNNMQRGITTPLYKYNYENFFYLEFPLEEVRKFIIGQNYNMMGMNMGMNYQNINQVDIEDCFKYYQKQNEMFGYCEKCGKDNAKIYSVTNIYSPPKILMIVLNRGKGLQFNIKINFKDNLIVKTLNNDQKYELRSVVKHLGDNSASGHLISYCKSPVQNYNQCWFCFNDTTVVQTNDWKSIIDTGVTYILFYKLLSK
jgi:ubiquitin C-terminal hydrolase